MKNYDSAAMRFRVGRDVLSPDAHTEYHLELCEALSELRAALDELRAFQERHLP